MTRRKTTPFGIRTAIVTGAASGIGARAVARLRADGVKVLATDLDENRLTSLYGDDADIVVVAGDVTDPQHTDHLVTTAQERLGSIDRLVHCAGIMPGGRVADLTREQLFEPMRVNYLGTVTMTTAVLPVMRQQGRGQVVVLGSLTGYVPTSAFAAYSASKAAVNSFVEVLGQEERRHGIQVLLVSPTAVKTPLLQQAHDGPAFVRRLARSERSPLMTTPDVVLDQVERGLARGARVVVPGGRALHALRKVSPGLVWFVTEHLPA
ncbi:Short-chain dehydrogenase [Quadrisphaera granulorum]|uniref:Short-subunit dehydrogenase n=1 Tax=Quadrisphaera granulorum TaxID=317664 RepID=A0A316ABS8_9ACTN|nr:SDR family oxidoreductase [Quadrisphaera granulorum]PWJ54324.1 short-subunit dehydrogenase [Quadrisphaera granulorum]SZE96096.1 Short-chain dehydrogenase [Quadrisphaera granulorum]